MPNNGRRFFIFLIALLVTGFLSVSLLSYFSARQSLSDQVVSEILPLTSVSVYSKIKQDLLHPISIASLMAHDTFVRDWVMEGEVEPERMTRYLKEIQGKYQATTSFFVSDSSRKYYHSSGVLREVDLTDSKDAWYQRVSQMSKDYEINIDIESRALNQLTVFINYRVYDYQGNYIGVTGVGLSVNSMQEMIESYRSSLNLDIFFTDYQGNILLYGPSFMPDGESYNNLRDIPGLEQVSQTLLTERSSELSYYKQGARVHLNSRLIEEFNWHLFVERQDDPWDKRIWWPLLINLAIGCLVSLLIIILVVMVIHRYQKQLKDLAETDKLTGVRNRRGFEQIWQLLSQSSKKRAENDGLGIVLLDIDHFKRVNDQYGHLIGDKVIEQTARCIKQQLKPDNDYIVRWGGEEFLLLLEGADAEFVQQKAEQIREAVANNKVETDSGLFSITVSIGCTLWDGKEGADHVIHRADKAMYLAKTAGRNQVCSDLPGTQEFTAVTID